MPIANNPIFLFAVVGSLLLGVSVIEIKFLTVFLKTSHIPLIHLLGLFSIGSIILVIMELYKMIKRSKKG
jgi:hypothetical protein